MNNHDEVGDGEFVDDLARRGVPEWPDALGEYGITPWDEEPFLQDVDPARWADLIASHRSPQRTAILTRQQERHDTFVASAITAGRRTWPTLKFPRSSNAAKRAMRALLIWDQRQQCAACGCGVDVNYSCVDHCHVTSLVRGVLCTGCNSREGRGDNTRELATYRRYPPAFWLEWTYPGASDWQDGAVGRLAENIADLHGVKRTQTVLAAAHRQSRIVQTKRNIAADQRERNLRAEWERSISTPTPTVDVWDIDV